MAKQPNRIELKCFEESKLVLALGIKTHISQQNAEDIVRQFDKHPYIHAYIDNQGTLYASVKYSKITFLSEEQDGSGKVELEYTLKY